MLLAALTLEKGAQKQSIYRAARLLVWAAYILLLNWRAGAMRLDADDCWLISVLGVPVAGAVYELLEQKGQVTAKWYHAPLALLGVSWCVLTVFLSVRYRAANAMEIYPKEYSTVCRLCNVVPLLAAVLAALCVIF